MSIVVNIRRVVCDEHNEIYAGDAYGYRFCSLNPLRTGAATHHELDLARAGTGSGHFLFENRSTRRASHD
eukprot:4624178-Pleurochrysis_carterae.AAC.4